MLNNYNYNCYIFLHPSLFNLDLRPEKLIIIKTCTFYKV